jgi:hypothetical protein
MGSCYSGLAQPIDREIGSVEMRSVEALECEVI